MGNQVDEMLEELARHEKLLLALENIAKHFVRGVGPLHKIMWNCGGMFADPDLGAALDAYSDIVDSQNASHEPMGKSSAMENQIGERHEAHLKKNVRKNVINKIELSKSVRKIGEAAGQIAVPLVIDTINEIVDWINSQEDEPKRPEEQKNSIAILKAMIDNYRSSEGANPGVIYLSQATHDEICALYKTTSISMVDNIPVQIVNEGYAIGLEPTHLTHPQFSVTTQEIPTDETLQRTEAVADAIASHLEKQMRSDEANMLDKIRDRVLPQLIVKKERTAEEKLLDEAKLWLAREVRANFDKLKAQIDAGENPFAESSEHMNMEASAEDSEDIKDDCKPEIEQQNNEAFGYYELHQDDRWLGNCNPSEIGGCYTDISNIALSLAKKVKDWFPTNEVPKNIVSDLNVLKNALEESEELIQKVIEHVNREVMVRSVIKY